MGQSPAAKLGVEIHSLAKSLVPKESSMRHIEHRNHVHNHNPAITWGLLSRISKAIWIFCWAACPPQKLAKKVDLKLDKYYKLKWYGEK
jgi:hypothetical protein